MTKLHIAMEKRSFSSWLLWPTAALAVLRCLLWVGVVGSIFWFGCGLSSPNSLKALLLFPVRVLAEVLRSLGVWNSAPASTPHAFLFWGISLPSVVAVGLYHVCYVSRVQLFASGRRVVFILKQCEFPRRSYRPPPYLAPLLLQHFFLRLRVLLAQREAALLSELAGAYDVPPVHAAPNASSSSSLSEGDGESQGPLRHGLARAKLGLARCLERLGFFASLPSALDVASESRFEKIEHPQTGAVTVLQWLRSVEGGGFLTGDFCEASKTGLGAASEASAAASGKTAAAAETTLGNEQLDPRGLSAALNSNETQNASSLGASARLPSGGAVLASLQNVAKTFLLRFQQQRQQAPSAAEKNSLGTSAAAASVSHKPKMPRASTAFPSTGPQKLHKARGEGAARKRLLMGSPPAGSEGFSVLASRTEAASASSPELSPEQTTPVWKRFPPRGVLVVVGAGLVGGSSLQTLAVAAEALRVGLCPCLVHLAADGASAQLLRLSKSRGSSSPSLKERAAQLGMLVSEAAEEVRRALLAVQASAKGLPLLVVGLGEAALPLMRALSTPDPSPASTSSATLRSPVVCGSCAQEAEKEPTATFSFGTENGEERNSQLPETATGLAATPVTQQEALVEAARDSAENLSVHSATTRVSLNSSADPSGPSSLPKDSAGRDELQKEVAEPTDFTQRNLRPPQPPSAKRMGQGRAEREFFEEPSLLHSTDEALIAASCAASVATLTSSRRAACGGGGPSSVSPLQVSACVFVSPRLHPQRSAIRSACVLGGFFERLEIDAQKKRLWDSLQTATAGQQRSCVAEDSPSVPTPICCGLALQRRLVGFGSQLLCLWKEVKKRSPPELLCSFAWRLWETHHKLRLGPLRREGGKDSLLPTPPSALKREAQFDAAAAKTRAAASASLPSNNHPPSPQGKSLAALEGSGAFEIHVNVQPPPSAKSAETPSRRATCVLESAFPGGVRQAWAADEAEAPSLLRRLHQPSLVVLSADDPFLDAAAVDVFAAARNKHLAFAVLQSGGHCVHLAGFVPRLWFARAAVEFCVYAAETLRLREGVFREEPMTART